MKKILISLLLIACLTPAVMALEYGEAYYLKNKRTFLSGNLNDPARMLRRELDGYGADGGDVFYVDGNMSDNLGNGQTWATAYQKLSTALAASHADIAVSADRQWASRNVIYVKGDGGASFDEDLVALAQKTDIVGVGSGHGRKSPILAGTHTIVAAATTNYMGCRFFNFTFAADTGATHLISLGADQNGIEFIGCTFEPLATSTYGITATSCHDLRIIGCRFNREGATDTGFATAAINIAAAAFVDLEIAGNWIDAETGIIIGNTDCLSSSIHDNYINATTMTIDENSDEVLVFDNTLTTATTIGVASFDLNQALANNNKISGSNGSEIIPALAEHAGRSLYVDSANGSATNTGLSWAQSVATIAQGLTRMANYDTLYVAGVSYTEDCITPAGIARGKIIGVCKNNQIPFWSATGAGATHLTLLSGEWEVANFRFNGGAATAPFVKIEWEAGSSIVRDCYFSGALSHNGIEVDGAPVDLKILRNRFTCFQSTDALDGAICGSAYGTQGALVWEIVGNSFFNCTKSINLLAGSCRIEGNTFSRSSAATSGVDPTIVISTHANAGVAGCGGGNVIVGNYFPHLTYQIDAANGYAASTYDVWAGNFCPDGMTVEKVPGAGTANLELEKVGSVSHTTMTLTGTMTDTSYGDDDDPVIFTVTGDILCRAFAIVNTEVITNNDDGSLALGVAGDTACLLVSDVADNTEFQANDTWSLDQPPETPSAELNDSWVVIPNGLDIQLFIGTNHCTSGVVKFYLEWIPMSADAEVVGAAP